MKKPIYSPYFFKRNFAFSVIAVVLCSLLLVGIFSYFVYNSNLKTLEQATVTVNDSCYKQVESVLDNLSRICMFFSSYKSISPVFQSQQTSIDLKKETLREEIRTFIACNDYIANITVITEEYTLRHGAAPYTVFSEPQKYKSFDISYSIDDGWPGILRISYTGDSLDFYSVYIDTYTYHLSDLFFAANSYCYAADGTLILGQGSHFLGSNISDTLGIPMDVLESNHIPGFLKASRTVDTTGYTILSLQDKRTVLPQVLLNILGYLSICVLVFAVVVSVIYAQLKRIYRPINKVIDVFKYYLPQNETFIEDDIKFISKCINDPNMGHTTQSAVLQIRKSQLYTLQSQISPHFLGNSLDIISWKSVATLGINNPISESLGILSLFLANSYEFSSMFDTLEHEIDRTNKYISLAQYCFIPNLTVNWNVDPAVLHYAIISMTLQPLIENSIVHGFVSPKSKLHATVDISILPQGNDIEIILKDNGQGMSASVLHAIHDALSSDEAVKHHIGLKNSHLKLKLLYGDKYGITNITSDHNGTRIQLLIPQYVYPDITSPPKNSK